MGLDRIIAVSNLKTVYRDGENCIKVFADGVSKGDILKEAFNQSVAEEIVEKTNIYAGELKIKVPEMKEVVSIDGKMSIVSAYVRGKTLKEKIEVHGDNIDEDLLFLATVQAAIHSLNCYKGVRLKDKSSDDISRTNLAATLRYDLHIAAQKLSNDTSLCHGNLTPLNIIISNDGVYVTDWSHASRGNAEADAAKTYICIYLSYGEEAAEKYLSYYCEKSGREENRVRWFLTMAAAAETAVCGKDRRKELKRWL